jgi:flagella basal body P-ring formation protein FlgA
MHRAKIISYFFSLILLIVSLFDAHANEHGDVMVPTLKRVIKPGIVIADEDIEYIKFGNNIAGNIALDAGEIVGKSLKHSIYPKTPVPLNVITEPFVIKANQSVTLLYKKDNITLKVSGIALDNGSLGSNIRVRNANSNQIIHGTVRDANIVIVGMAE